MNRSEGETRFRDLFDRHHQTLMAYFMRRLPNEADALDATEDVFLVAWRKLDKVPDGDAALLWLYGVARKVLGNQRRGDARLSRLRRKIAAEPVYPPRDPASEVVLSVEEERLLAALARLPVKDREVLLLTYWEHLPHEDIGRILGCSTEAVHVRRYRAVKRLGNAFHKTGHIPGETRPRVQTRRSHNVE